MVVWDTDVIKERLSWLAAYDAWPSEWGQQEEDRIGDFFGWCHRYQQGESIFTADVEAFERAHNIALPHEYRSLVIDVGDGCAGPHYGIFPLGIHDEQPMSASILQNLATEFEHREAFTQALTDEMLYSGQDPSMAGAMPVATAGCNLDYWLVITGPASGQIWYDARVDGLAVEPVRGSSGQPVQFGEWYLDWLDDAVALHTALRDPLR